MSNREYAVDLIKALSDEQVDCLVKLIVSLSNVRESERQEDTDFQEDCDYLNSSIK